MSSARRVDPFGFAALAAAGTLVGHELGYLSDAGDGGVSHAYLGALGPAVVLALCLAAWSSAVRVLRRDPGRLPTPAALMGLQIGLFVAMEAGERLTTGSTSSLLATPVVLGVVLQPLVAWTALRLVSFGHRVLESLLALDHPTDSPTAVVLWQRQVRTFVDAIVGDRLRVRGPPML